MKEIPVRGGYVAQVDEEDYLRLSSLKWRAELVNGVVYAKTNLPRGDRKRASPRMHQLIIPAKIGFRIDHRDGDGLMNCKSNLRYATMGQQKQNSSRRKAGSSRYKGVTRSGNKWQIQVKAAGVVVFRARVKDEADAATIYNFSAAEAHGEFFRGNCAI